jgi:glycosyltransferase involved in cell wall biosynthesis
MQDRERAIWREVDVALYPSDEEAAMVAAMEPTVSVQAVQPYAFDRFGVTRPPPPGRQVIFVAGFGHPPNEDAVCWFVRAVLPLILARVPGACLSVVGSQPTAQVRGLASDTVRIVPDVPDAELDALYAGARVAVVPLRCGAGVKLKVAEALREGVPLVTTPVGAQGLPGVEAVVHVETEPGAFADAVCALLLEDQAWERRSAAQIAYASARFGTDALARSLLQACGITMLPELSLAA